MIERLRTRFPRFAARLATGEGGPIENVQPAATEQELVALEQELGRPLPVAYRDFLRCSWGFWLRDGAIQFERPFYHDFPPRELLPEAHQRHLDAEGTVWPPPSQGMLCFAEFFVEADGDQVLFDVHRGLPHGEYPIMYYAHERRPPSVRKMADTFEDWLDRCLDCFIEEPES